MAIKETRAGRAVTGSPAKVVFAVAAAIVVVPVVVPTASALLRRMPHVVPVASIA